MSEAMAKILSHYVPYIRYWSKGDEQIYQQAQSRLMYAIVSGFDISRT